MLNASVSDEISRILLSDNPDIKGAEALLAAEGLALADASDVIYDATRQINRRHFYPLSKVELLLAEGCDMACTYCFESAILDPALKGRRRVMSDDVIRRAIDLTFDYSAEGEMICLTLFGGEPTLNFRGMKTATAALESRAKIEGRQHYITTTTNALHLSGEVIDFLGAHDIRTLVSMDGARATHDLYRKDRRGQGTYDRILANMKALKKVQPWMGVKITVMPSEAAKLYDNVRELYSEGVNQFLIGAATGVDWNEEARAALSDNWARLGAWALDDKPEHLRISDFEDYSPPLPGGRYGCGAGRSTIAVNVAGDISGCSKIVSIDHDRTIGKLGDVWHGLYMIRARQEMSRCDKLERNCHAAGIADGFEGGCFATNFDATGDLYQPSLLDDAMARERNRVVHDVLAARGKLPETA